MRRRGPALERRRHILEEGAFQLVAFKSALPDAALQALERGGFAVAIHQPVQVRNGLVPVFRVRELGRLISLSSILFGEQLQIVDHAGISAMFFEEFLKSSARIGKELFVNKRDRRDRALYVKKKELRRF